MFILFAYAGILLYFLIVFLFNTKTSVYTFSTKRTFCVTFVVFNGFFNTFAASASTYIDIKSALRSDQAFLKAVWQSALEQFSPLLLYITNPRFLLVILVGVTFFSLAFWFQNQKKVEILVDIKEILNKTQNSSLCYSSAQNQCDFVLNNAGHTHTVKTNDNGLANTVQLPIELELIKTADSSQNQKPEGSSKLLESQLELTKILVLELKDTIANLRAENQSLTASLLSKPVSLSCEADSAMASNARINSLENSVIDLYKNLLSNKENTSNNALNAELLQQQNLAVDAKLDLLKTKILVPLETLNTNVNNISARLNCVESQLTTVINDFSKTNAPRGQDSLPNLKNTIADVENSLQNTLHNNQIKLSTENDHLQDLVKSQTDSVTTLQNILNSQTVYLDKIQNSLVDSVTTLQNILNSQTSSLDKIQNSLGNLQPLQTPDITPVDGFLESTPESWSLTETTEWYGVYDIVRNPFSFIYEKDSIMFYNAELKKHVEMLTASEFEAIDLNSVVKKEIILPTRWHDLIQGLFTLSNQVNIYILNDLGFESTHQPFCSPETLFSTVNHASIQQYLASISSNVRGFVVFEFYTRKVVICSLYIITLGAYKTNPTSTVKQPQYELSSQDPSLLILDFVFISELSFIALNILRSLIKQSERNQSTFTPMVFKEKFEQYQTQNATWLNVDYQITPYTVYVTAKYYNKKSLIDLANFLFQVYHPMCYENITTNSHLNPDWSRTLSIYKSLITVIVDLTREKGTYCYLNLLMGYFKLNITKKGVRLVPTALPLRAAQQENPAIAELDKQLQLKLTASVGGLNKSVSAAKKATRRSKSNLTTALGRSTFKFGACSASINLLLAKKYFYLTSATPLIQCFSRNSVIIEANAANDYVSDRPVRARRRRIAAPEITPPDNLATNPILDSSTPPTSTPTAEIPFVASPIINESLATTFPDKAATEASPMPARARRRRITAPKITPSDNLATNPIPTVNTPPPNTPPVEKLSSSAPSTPETLSTVQSTESSKNAEKANLYEETTTTKQNVVNQSLSSVKVLHGVKESIETTDPLDSLAQCRVLFLDVKKLTYYTQEKETFTFSGESMPFEGLLLTCDNLSKVIDVKCQKIDLFFKKSKYVDQETTTDALPAYYLEIYSTPLSYDGQAPDHTVLPLAECLLNQPQTINAKNTQLFFSENTHSNVYTFDYTPNCNPVIIIDINIRNDNKRFSFLPVMWVNYQTDSTASKVMWDKFDTFISWLFFNSTFVKNVLTNSFFQDSSFKTEYVRLMQLKSTDFVTWETALANNTEPVFYIPEDRFKEIQTDFVTHLQLNPFFQKIPLDRAHALVENCRALLINLASVADKIGGNLNANAVSTSADLNGSLGIDADAAFNDTLFSSMRATILNQRAYNLTTKEFLYGYLIDVVFSTFTKTVSKNYTPPKGKASPYRNIPAYALLSLGRILTSFHRLEINRLLIKMEAQIDKAIKTDSDKIAVEAELLKKTNNNQYFFTVYYCGWQVALNVSSFYFRNFSSQYEKPIEGLSSTSAHPNAGIVVVTAGRIANCNNIMLEDSVKFISHTFESCTYLDHSYYVIYLISKQCALFYKSNVNTTDYELACFSYLNLSKIANLPATVIKDGLVFQRCCSLIGELSRDLNKSFDKLENSTEERLRYFLQESDVLLSQTQNAASKQLKEILNIVVTLIGTRKTVQFLRSTLQDKKYLDEIKNKYQVAVTGITGGSAPPFNSKVSSTTEDLSAKPLSATINQLNPISDSALNFSFSQTLISGITDPFTASNPLNSFSLQRKNQEKYQFTKNNELPITFKNILVKDVRQHFKKHISSMPEFVNGLPIEKLPSQWLKSVLEILNNTIIMSLGDLEKKLSEDQIKTLEKARQDSENAALKKTKTKTKKKTKAAPITSHSASPQNTALDSFIKDNDKDIKSLGEIELASVIMHENSNRLFTNVKQANGCEQTYPNPLLESSVKKDCQEIYQKTISDFINAINDSSEDVTSLIPNGLLDRLDTERFLRFVNWSRQNESRV